MVETQPSADACTWAMLCHLAALPLVGAPFGHIIGPLVVYLLKKDEDPFIADQGKESLNFQITIAIVGFLLVIGYVAGIIAMIVMDGKTPWFLFVVPLFLLLGLFDLASIVFACVRAYHGERFRYPMSIRFIR
jgi:uncharacterized Tic20 family protein